MKKRIILTLSVIALVSLVAFFWFKSSGQVGSGKTKFVIVKSAEMMRSDIYKPNAALLITDKKLISELEGLFSLNKTYGHACGYHYEIEFWESSTKKIESIPYNVECEEFLRNNFSIHRKMKGFISQLEKSPDYFIYNLEINSNISPDSVLKALSNRNVFSFYGTSENLPYIEFSYEHVSDLVAMKDKSKWQEEQDRNEQLAINGINTILDSLKSNITVSESSEPDFSMSGFGATIEHEYAMLVKFPLGTDLKQAKEIIIRMGGEIEKSEITRQYYIQALENIKDLKQVENIYSEYSFINDVFEYPNEK